MTWANRARATRRRLVKHFGDGATLTVKNASTGATVAGDLSFRRRAWTATEIGSGRVAMDTFAVELDDTLTADIDKRHQVVFGGKSYSVVKVLPHEPGVSRVGVTLEVKA